MECIDAYVDIHTKLHSLALLSTNYSGQAVFLSLSLFLDEFLRKTPFTFGYEQKLHLSTLDRYFSISTSLQISINSKFFPFFALDFSMHSHSHTSNNFSFLFPYQNTERGYSCWIVRENCAYVCVTMTKFNGFRYGMPPYLYICMQCRNASIAMNTFIRGKEKSW